MEERGVIVDHATLNRWLVKFAPLIASRAQVRKHPTANSWRAHYQSPASEMSQQYSRTGPSFYQTDHPANVGLQGFPCSLSDHRRHRDRPHDLKGSNPCQRDHCFPDLRRVGSISVSAGYPSSVKCEVRDTTLCRNHCAPQCNFRIAAIQLSRSICDNRIKAVRDKAPVR